MNNEPPEPASLPTPAPAEGLVLVINAGSSSPMAAISSAAGPPPPLWGDQRPGNGAAGALAAFLALGRGRWPVVLNQGYRFASAKQDGVSEVR